MRDRIVITAVLALVAACPAFGQALAEGAMVHAGAAGTTAKVGSALGNALSRTTSQVGQHVQTVTHPVLGSGTPTNVTTNHHATSSIATTNSSNSSSASGPMIVSVLGTRKSLTAAPTRPAKPANSSTSESAQPGQGNKAPTTTPSQSKSVVNVPN